MRTRRALRSRLLGLVSVTMLGGAVSAHHSSAAYDADDKQLTVNGVVTEYRWKNPHVFVVWETKDTSGKIVQWLGELASVNTMISEGMKRDTLKPGDAIVVTAIPAKDGNPQGLIKKVARPDGTLIVDMTRVNVREP